MALLKAKLYKGVPVCPQCNFSHRGIPDEYGVDRKNDGYFFIFICPVCSTKKSKGVPKKTIRVKYYTDNDLKVIQRRGKNEVVK